MIPLSFILCGYISDLPFAILISNFERWNPQINGPPQPKFHGEYAIMKENYNPKQFLGLCINGSELALTGEISHKLKRLRKKRFFQNETAGIIASRLVNVIREASRAPNHGKYIGRDCMTVVISRNLSEDIVCEYHPEGESLMRYAPHIIHRMDSISISMKHIEIEGNMGVSALMR